MRIRKYITLVICTLLCALSLFAESYNLPKHKIGNQYYYIYEVEKKENIYSVCKKLGISKDELVKHNPRAVEGVKAGDKIFIPAENEVIDSSTEPETIHQVQKDETIYAISKRYDTTPEEIVKANPDAADGVKNGDNIIIPAKP
ncbi:MAG: LysM peptidoglycan-binding domain-containing protein, partial [Muribaculaceae bacterium]|nr:LysM peptidoglycan-binding domain-containing protein [Muribaculaceae bacterium]